LLWAVHVLKRGRGGDRRNVRARAEIEAVGIAWGECGFCEPVCPARHVTTTPRQGMGIRRGIAGQEEGSPLRRALLGQYEDDGILIFAVDGWCMHACPVGITRGAVLEQAVGEATRRGARIEGHGPCHRHLELCQRVREFEPAATDVGGRRPQLDGRVLGDHRPRLDDHLTADTHVTGQDVGCQGVTGLGATRTWSPSSTFGKLLGEAVGGFGKLVPGTHPSSVPTGVSGMLASVA